MLIKRAAPPGATGRVPAPCTQAWTWAFAWPPVFGAMLDRGMTSGIFFGSAATLALSVVSAAFVGVGLAARMARPAVAAKFRSRALYSRLQYFASLVALLFWTSVVLSVICFISALTAG